MYPNTSFSPPVGRALTTSGVERLAFLRKVYTLFLGGIVSASVGAGVALYAGSEESSIVMKGTRGDLHVPPLVGWFYEHAILGMIVYFGAFFAMRAVRNMPVVNVAALFGFTFVSGLFISPILFIANAMGSEGMSVSASPVRDAFLLTTAAFTGLTAFVFISKKDFSYLGGFLSMGFMVLFGAMILGMFVGGQAMQLGIASAGVLLFAGYVLYDTSRILHSQERLDPVGAALQLYLDFLNIFLFILRILMSARRSD